MHVVLSRFGPGIDWDDPRAAAAEAASRSHPRHISAIRGWRCGRDVSGRAEAADFVVVAEFDSQRDLDAFQAHPNHHEGKVLCGEIATWRVADFPATTSGAS